MNYWQLNTCALLIGFLLDLLLGDPEGWPHPVIWMGRFISRMEKKLRARGGDLRRAALLLTASTVLLSMAVTALALWLLSRLGQVPLLLGMSVIAWTTLSCKCLANEGKGVAAALSISVEKGRTQVARIVGRDTQSLAQDEIICATVETIAENTTDGVVAPMLYLLLGGPVLAIGFKAASTLDSMVGYMDEKYRDIGWSSARLDDILNFIPARLCGLLMCVAAAFARLDALNAFRIMRRDHANHLSPNCAWSEAAAAGALHIRLGGTHTYFGKRVYKPGIGDRDRRVEIADIDRANRLLYGTSVLAAFLMALLGFRFGGVA